MNSRLRRIGAPVVVSLALALAVGPSANAAVPGGYDATPAVNPPVTAGDEFGLHIANAGDVNADGLDDLIVGVPKATTGLPNITGKVVYVDGRSGGIIRTVGVPFPQVSHAGANTDFGAQVARLGDVTGDGVPEQVVSAPGTDVTSAGLDMGVVYVLNGSNGQIVKQIQLDPADRPDTPPSFGASLVAGSGDPACLGHGGTAACPNPDGSRVAIGDVDGGGKPDILVGAPDFAESSESDAAGCDAPFPQTCPALGRVYVYLGEDLGGSALAPLTAPFLVVQYFDKATASQRPRMGAAIAPLGDVGQCQVPDNFAGTSSSCLTVTEQTAPTSAQDDYPDYMISAPGVTVGGAANAGVAFVADGRHGLVIGALGAPDAQADTGLGPSYAQGAPGNLGGGATPDFFLAAPGLDVAAADQGRAYVFDGNINSPASLATIDDPSPTGGARFGTFASLGDMAGDDGLGELALGRAGGGPVQIFSSCRWQVIHTIADRDPGNRFGAAIAPLGDLNGDGYLDLAIGAPGVGSSSGQVYLMRSNGTDAGYAGCNPPPPPGGGGGGGGGGGSGGGGGGTNPGGGSGNGGKKTKALAKRKIVFVPLKSKVKTSSIVRFRGKLKASKRNRVCQSRVKVAILRFESGSGFWHTVDVSITKRNGAFGARTRLPVPATYYYRASVKATGRCAAVMSKRIAVKVTD